MPLKITKALMKKAMKAKKANDAKWSPVLDEWGIDTYGVLYRLASGELVETLLGYLGHLWTILAILGPCWGHLEVILEPSWDIFGYLGAILERSWPILAQLAHLGAILDHLGAMLALLGAIYVYLGVFLGASWLILGPS